MKIKKQPIDALNMSCPVPPWTPKNIVKLAQYLGVSQAKITKLLGISYSALRAWIDGRSKNISSKIMSKLYKFEGKINQLRAKAEAKFKEAIEKDERRKSRLPKPWAVSRIRSFMHTWGMTQVELAIFAQVSYDTVTSWSRGRRRLVRKENSDHLSKAEKIAMARGFPKGSPESAENPWVGHRRFLSEKGKEPSTAIPKNCQGSFLVQALEKKPGDFKIAKNAAKITINPGKKRDQLKVKIFLAKEHFEFLGIWRKLGGVKVIELQADPQDALFFNGKAGCITPGKNMLKVSLWATNKAIPLRLSAYFEK
jgi:DNA-binding transcriptional regulator YiaG